MFADGGGEAEGSLRFGAAPGVTLFSVLQGANEQGSRGRVFVTRAQTEHGE
jgi:hypothetical protein